MLEKLRSRHPIDLPDGAWGQKKGILTILGGIAVLFVIVPLLLSPLAALSVSVLPVLIAIGAGFGTLFVALLFGAARGKFGWQR